MKKFLKPEIEFIKFSNKDVISTSGGGQIQLPSTEIDPLPNSPLLQKGWSAPTFNK